MHLSRLDNEVFFKKVFTLSQKSLTLISPTISLPNQKTKESL
jgi:hypothetical protein